LLKPAGQLAVIFFLAAPMLAQDVPVKERILDNGLRFLFLPREGSPNITAGWVARVGSVHERPSITGIAHLFEHMMFKGTHVLGTRDIEKNLAIMAELDRVKEELDREQQLLTDKQRLGEAPNPPGEEDLTARHKELLKELARLTEEERKVLVKDEFDQIYTAAGASGMNAGTTHDFTIYFVNVPANKLELWFWMESDRLLNPVFREFYSERDVVREERRMRIESTPIGRFQEEFDAMFWQSSPYGWPVIGWPSDIEAITRTEALTFYDIYYAPNNLTACLVGDFDPGEAMEFANRYFGRLKRGARPPPGIRTIEVPQVAEMRMKAYAETKPQTIIRYHTVADGHVDDFALTLLGDILNGLTGRLYKSLVLDQKIANEGRAGQHSLKYEGYFELAGVAKPGKTPEDVEEAIYLELKKLQDVPVAKRELQKVKNQRAADDFRKLRSNFSLMLQLLIRDAYRGWTTINTDSPRLQAVTAEELQRVAKKYFAPENRTVATYYTDESAATEVDPLLKSLTEEQRTQVRQVQASLLSAKPENLRKMLTQMKQQADSVPEEQRSVFNTIQAIVERQLKGLEEGSK
jgi:predicted Zn-dependent peptidase